MTLVYRAIWQDDRDNLGDGVQTHFADWVKDRSGGQIEVDGPGKYEAEVGTLSATSTIDVSSEVVTDDQGHAVIVRNSYVITTHNGERWHTLVRAWSDDTGGFCWVDNSVVGNSTLSARSLDIISPRIARTLIETSVCPRVGDIGISVKPRHFSGPGAVDELADLISDFDRTIPVVVFAQNDVRFAEYGGATPFSAIVEETAVRLAGIAVIARADENVANELSKTLSSDFGVYNGAFRVYARDVDPAVQANSYRHRYVTADRYMRDKDRAAALAGRIVGPESTLRRPPSAFDAIKARLNRARTNDFEELYRIKNEEYENARQKVIDLREENVALLEWQQETERLSAQLEYAKGLLITNGICDDFDDDRNGNFYPRPPQTSIEAVALATKYLADRVEIHPDALRDAKQMDRTNEGADWANIAWQGFKALHAYARYIEDHPSKNVDFKTWCEGRSNSTGWPAEKAARGESGITKAQQKGTRLFPVSAKVSRDECVEMLAHLKVKLKGNSSIPRIYFMYSDRTKKVHVGFYGPHGLVQNTRS